METKAADQVSDFVIMLDKIEGTIRMLIQQRDELQKKIDHIEQLGWVDAKPHYRNGKYLYLIYPMVDGERRREYIGANSVKIQEALARIDRKEKYWELNKQLGILERYISQVKQSLVNAISPCIW